MQQVLVLFGAAYVSAVSILALTLLVGARQASAPHEESLLPEIFEAP